MIRFDESQAIQFGITVHIYLKNISFYFFILFERMTHVCEESHSHIVHLIHIHIHMQTNTKYTRYTNIDLRKQEQKRGRARDTLYSEILASVNF